MFDELIELLRSNAQLILSFVLKIPCVIIALVIHEFAHSFTAYKLGDPTAKAEGRVSLNPFKHIDPVGAVCLFLFQVGWAKPVPINPKFFKNRRTGVVLTSLAGPLANFIASYICVIFFVIFLVIAQFNTSLFFYYVISVLTQFFLLLSGFNLVLALFNLLPIFPLDGSRILMTLLPRKISKPILRYEKYIAIGFIILLIIDNFTTKFIPSALEIVFDFVINTIFLYPIQNLANYLLFIFI